MMNAHRVYRSDEIMWEEITIASLTTTCDM